MPAEVIVDGFLFRERPFEIRIRRIDGELRLGVAWHVDANDSVLQTNHSQAARHADHLGASFDARHHALGLLDKDQALTLPRA